MKGRIKRYIDDKGFGFISGDDNLDYFFHISDVKSGAAIIRGIYVEFNPSQGDKGLVAKDIVLCENNISNKQFIVFDNIRIKKNNIKSYGISTGTVKAEKDIEYKHAIDFAVMAIISQGIPPQKMDVDVKKSYLYVTTYQGDNYKFWEHEVEFDIFEKVKELDSFLT